jgi:hypothetical protein
MEKGNWDEIHDLSMGAPHVLLLGAGASLSAFPNGDKHGRKLPLMKNLVEICGIDRILSQAGINIENRNFEDLYSEVYESTDKGILNQLESAVFTYFQSLELPDYPTIYDYIAASMRPKDLIATFNWDPLLWQALRRNHNWAPGPTIVFLHGNAAIGHCVKDRQHGNRGADCTKCGKRYVDSKLLYPVTKKNYSQDEYISDSWNCFEKALSHAYLLTIFGYGAPSSDVEAVAAMRKAWGSADDRSIEQIELIDTKSELDLRETWGPFICREHYHTTDDYFKSTLCWHPRRTCEWLWSTYMMLIPSLSLRMPKTRDWLKFSEIFSPRIEAERTDRGDTIQMP